MTTATEWIPARALRRPRLDRNGLILSALLLVVLEVVLYWALPAVMAAFASLLGVVSPAPVRDVPFLGGQLAQVDFSLATLDYVELLIWTLVTAIVVPIVLVELRSTNPAIRAMAAYVTILVGASAIAEIFTGHSPFSPAQFSLLYSQTQVIIWLLLPLLVGLATLAIPVGWWLRPLLMIAILAFDVVLGAVRFGFFAWVLSWVGPVLMAPLYFIAGPILDFVCAVAMFSWLLQHAARRLAKQSPDDAWHS